ncbi:MAG: N-acetylmuramic acid 6-phosphate etherase [bacterium]
MGSTILDDLQRLREALEELNGLVTEQPNESSERIDELPIESILQTINAEDARVSGIVRQAIPQIAEVVAAAVRAISSGGRLMYVGAGTSGRLGVLDAAECPPTYGVPTTLVTGLIAGGLSALTVAQEGAEDDVEQARRDFTDAKITSSDAVLGITARGKTPWVREILKLAHEQGGWTGLITCNPIEPSPEVASMVILDVGPEVVTGSTRMKAGLATKMALTMISTAAMIRLGRVRGNRMVDLMPNSDKLRARQVKTIMESLDVTVEEAVARLKGADGDLRHALEGDDSPDSGG